MTLRILLTFALTFCLLRAEEPQPVYDRYHETAARLISLALEDNAGLERLAFLCDRIGNRLSGSPALDRAIDWAQVEMKRAGLVNVRTIRVKVPHWVRGQESAALISPLERPIVMLGLGGSVATPPNGITAEVVPVRSFDELTKLGHEKVQGRIVLFNVPYTGYGNTVVYRAVGASRAAQLGAVAALVRSVTPLSLRSAHTGMLRYLDGVAKLPAAAVSIEDAEAIQRLHDAGNTVRVRLQMQAHFEADADSADVMGEIAGSEKAAEIVVMGGHIDSWDVGQGAQDDGSGIMAALQAAAVIHQLGLRPKRTIRVVFWTNEENGGAGGRGYRDWVGDTHNHVAAIEMDEGAEKPLGFDIGVGGQRQGTGAQPAISAEAVARAAAVAKLLDPIQAGKIVRGFGGADIEPLMGTGVPGLGLLTVNTHYFDWHHTQADTFDKIDPLDFKMNVAALAVMSYVLADMDGRLDDK